VNFDFPDNIKELQQELRRLLSKACPRTRVRAVLDGDTAAARSLTAELAAQGWMSAALSEAYGGQGLSYVALCAIAEELGRALAPTAFGSSIFLAAEAIVLHGSEAQRQHYLPALGNGSCTGVLAIAERGGALDERGIQCHFDAGKLTGRKLAVVDGLDADVAVVAARSAAGVQLFLVELSQAGVGRVPETSIDPTRPTATLTFTAAAAAPLGAAIGWEPIQRVLDRAAVLFAFEQLGSADAALAMARDYALQRVAFGRKIGSFQAIKHKLAEVYIANELARANAHYAGDVLAAGGAELPLAAATARVAACEALERAARENMQCHGGVSATWANDCHLFYRRARHLGTCIGSVHQWRDRAAALLIAEHLDGEQAAPLYAADTPEEAAYRRTIRDWISAHSPPFLMGPAASAEDRLRLGRGWMAAKAAAGYAGISLPRDIGGQGRSPLEEIIFYEEENRVFMGNYDESFGGNLVGMAIPTILTHAQPGWAERLIAPTLSGEYLWCQLFSEPGAGSDLAGIRTRAVRDGLDWIINGQKIWTSGAQNADWGLLLTRSDPARPKHQGLTYFLVNMHSPGVEVRPLKQISGRADFNEVFFSDVRISDTQRMGEVHGGWLVAMTTMMNERLSLMTEPSTSRDIVPQLIRIASRTVCPRGGMMTEDSLFRDQLASYNVVVAGMRQVRASIRAVLGRGQVPGPEATIGKVTTARWLQEMCNFAMDMLGPASITVDVAAERDLAAVQENYLLVIGYRIGGGTEEIAKNIISERLLGLPQEMRPDKSLPFNEPPAAAVAKTGSAPGGAAAETR
jgi:alkylation response protein AidB-like acyl-CoA dehydrogenase